MYRQLFAVVVALVGLAMQLSQAHQNDLVEIITPKVMIISMFTPEAEVWQRALPETGLGDLADMQIAVPGLSMLFPRLLCVADGSICQVTIGEGEINGAATMMALVLSDALDLSKTYFIVSGIAGVNPKHGTLGSVALAKYTVQVALQHEIDARSIPDDWETGYLAYGTARPFQYPAILYGTEVMELNENLRDRAFELASNATLLDSQETMEYRQKYLNGTGTNGIGAVYVPAAQPPTLLKCDAATSDVYYTGDLLSRAFERVTEVWTNGSATYCMTAQEDNATLQVLLRADIEGRADYNRAIVMRAGSNFDRPPPNVSPVYHLVESDQNGLTVAVANLFNAGIKVIKGIIDHWDCEFEAGIEPSNYVGDVFGSLGGHPDFGPGSLTDGARVEPGGRSPGTVKRAMSAEARSRQSGRRGVGGTLRLNY